MGKSGVQPYRRKSAFPFRYALFLICLAALTAPVARADKLHLPPEAVEGLRILYNGDPDTALPLFLQVQKAQPDHPLGYLLEAEARWWKIYCQSLDIKWNLIDSWRHAKLPEDADYFALVDKATRLSEDALAKKESAEMHFYAGMGLLLRGRLLALRDEKRATARAGVKAREHLLRALALDPDLADAYTGLGLYNYYVDTLSAIARILRFFMGIPGGSKQEGMRQLEHAMKDGELTAVEARFYLGRNLRNFDRDYERAANVLTPLTEEYPQNPLFLLLLGDMNAKLNRKEKAAASFHAAEALIPHDARCAQRLAEVIQAALATLNGSPSR